MAIVGIIPARYGFTRRAGMPLSDIPGRNLTGRTCVRARPAPGAVGASGAAVDEPEDLERGRARGAPEKGRVA
ncbi:MAG: hypothetical protein LJF15_15870 [Acidobacteria bacterium]|nr:hypothetical protein [Acidobacteriota bacterium]